MKLFHRISFRKALSALIALSIALQPVAGSAALLNLVKTPLFVSPPIPPLVMLAMSKDQQLFKKAYNDYSDLDGDGVIETTYKHSIDYYGYFDAYKCYTYGTSTLSGTNHFIPSNWSSTKYCDGTKWSGNFLNWVTMSRMDAVRKLLFGGARSTDVATASGYGSVTILDRSYIPTDAHSWAKYYNGSDINRLTPFNPTTTAPATDINNGATCPAVNANTAGSKAFCNVGSTFMATVALGDQIKAISRADPTKSFIGRVTSFGNGSGNYVEVRLDRPVANFNDTQWNLSNLTTPGISFCNTTRGDSNRYSQENRNPPLMRVVSGNFELWSASERLQCQLYEEDRGRLGLNNAAGNSAGGGNSNGNQGELSGLLAGAENPSRAGYTNNSISSPARGLGDTDYNVRVEACHNSFIPVPANQGTTERCKQYDQVGIYKPIGLLQVYAEDGRILFGLMTGSYNKNISGGVLRKNVSDLSTEIDSNGRFVNDPLNGTIIRNLSRMRMYGYDYNDGLYNNNDNCPFQMTSAELVDGSCRSWGNPMSEIYAETLRYFAGATSPTAAFSADDSALFTSRVRTAPWPSPNNVLTNNNYCTPLNVLVFNASVSSKDHDQVANPFVGVSGTPAAMTDAVGTAEGMVGQSFFVGSGGGTTSNQCDSKTFTAGNQLGTAQGICPEAPALNGTYLMAGLAHTARTNRIRNDLTGVPSTDTKSLKVATYGISLATNVPRIEVVVPGGGTSRKVIIQPQYRLVKGATNFGAGAIVDVKVVPYPANKVCPTGGTCGRLYVNWEDSEQGGDYDQDVWGIIDYTVTSTTATVTTDVVASSTGGFAQGFGYVISGTNRDGPHFHSGILNFGYNDPLTVAVTNGVTGAAMNSGAIINASGGCVSCVVGDPPTTATYTVSTAGAANILKDPLYYAAKYGGFVDSDNNNLPNVQAEWDNFNNDTGALGSDGVPDNFFFVTNPLGLEKSLDKLFISILQASAASAVAANSSKLNTSTRVYQAVFNPSDWSGKMLAFGVNASTGTPNTTPDWDAGQIDLNATTVNPGGRAIVTYNKGGSSSPRGIPFRWPASPSSPLASELTPAQITALRTNSDTSTVESPPSPYVEASDPGFMRLQFLRGESTNEGLASTNYRRRTTTKLGDIINSNPNFVGAPAAGYPDATYTAFATANKNRKTMLYVGANDGMLHAFNACPPSTETDRPSQCGVGKTTPGSELLGYIPSKVYPNLSKLTSRAYSHEYFVDGSPVVEDAQIGTAWKSVLVAGLNRGGQGIYALDVTDPENFAEANASTIALWEFTDADDPDLGYTFGTPIIRKMRNGKWAAIVSGGYNNSQGPSSDPAEISCSSGLGTVASPYRPNINSGDSVNCTTSLTGQAYVFVIFLDGPSGTNGRWVQGTDYIKISTGTGSVATPNGVGSPFAGDINGDGMVDVIYAGDLDGSLWRFDVTSTTATTWASSGSRLKLFTALDASNNPQPITAGIEAALHPSGNGVIVSFGTGKYLEANDINPPGPAYLTQTIYGIWDKFDGTAVTGRSQLMPQLLQPGITNIVTNPDGSVSRITTRHQPNYSSSARTSPDATLNDSASNLADKIAAVSNLASTPANQRGWYIDLFNAQATGIPSGERIIYAPFVRSGVVFYASLWPVGNTCLGSTAGDNITLMMSTGARPDASVFDLDANALVNASDLVNVGTVSNPINVAVSSRRIAGGSAQPPTLVSKGTQFVGFQNPTGGQLEKIDLKLPGQPGRVSWREILY